MVLMVTLEYQKQKEKQKQIETTPYPFKNTQCKYQLNGNSVNFRISEIEIAKKKLLECYLTPIKKTCIKTYFIQVELVLASRYHKNKSQLKHILYCILQGSI